MKLKLSRSRLLAIGISIVLILAILLVSGGCGFKSEFEYETDWDETSVTQPLDPTPYLSDDRDEAWRNDLKYMVDNLRAFHGDLFYEMSEQDFDNAVSKLHDSIPSLTDNGIIIELSRILAMIGDTHTGLIRSINSSLAPIDPSHPLSKYFQYPELSFRAYPIRAYWFTDGLFVIGSTREYTETLGTRIIQIGNKTPEEIMELVRPLISHSTEERIASASPTYIVSPEILHTLGIIDDMEDAAFTFEDSEGNTFELNLSPCDPSLVSEEDMKSQKFSTSGLSPLTYKQNPLWETALVLIEEDSYPLYLKDPFSYYWFEYLEEYNTVYFQFNMVLDIPEGRSFASFFKEMLRFIDRNDVDKLVMDFRFNGGGNFRIPEEQFVNLGKHKINKEGQIFTIISRRTGSACIVSTQFVRENTESLLFGEGVVDTLDMYYDNPAIDLPNSKLGFVLGYGPHIFPDRDEQILPDVKIEISSEDYLSGRDLVLERILSY